MAKKKLKIYRKANPHKFGVTDYEIVLLDNRQVALTEHGNDLSRIWKKMQSKMRMKFG